MDSQSKKIDVVANEWEDEKKLSEERDERKEEQDRDKKKVKKFVFFYRNLIEMKNSFVKTTSS